MCFDGLKFNPDDLDSGEVHPCNKSKPRSEWRPNVKKVTALVRHMTGGKCHPKRHHGKTAVETLIKLYNSKVARKLAIDKLMSKDMTDNMYEWSKASQHIRDELTKCEMYNKKKHFYETISILDDFGLCEDRFNHADHDCVEEEDAFKEFEDEINQASSFENPKHRLTKLSDIYEKLTAHKWDCVSGLTHWEPWDKRLRELIQEHQESAQKDHEENIRAKNKSIVNRLNDCRPTKGFDCVKLTKFIKMIERHDWESELDSVSPHSNDDESDDEVEVDEVEVDEERNATKNDGNALSKDTETQSNNVDDFNQRQRHLKDKEDTLSKERADFDAEKAAFKVDKYDLSKERADFDAEKATFKVDKSDLSKERTAFDDEKSTSKKRSVSTSSASSRKRVKIKEKYQMNLGSKKKYQGRFGEVTLCKLVHQCMNVNNSEESLRDKLVEVYEHVTHLLNKKMNVTFIRATTTSKAFRSKDDVANFRSEMLSKYPGIFSVKVLSHTHLLLFTRIMYDMCFRGKGMYTTDDRKIADDLVRLMKMSSGNGEGGRDFFNAVLKKIFLCSFGKRFDSGLTRGDQYNVSYDNEEQEQEQEQEQEPEREPEREPEK